MRDVPNPISSHHKANYMNNNTASYDEAGWDAVAPGLLSPPIMLYAAGSGCVISSSRMQTFMKE